jgi:RNA polymerase sigma-70 factor (ECF subfamily)
VAESLEVSDRELMGRLARGDREALDPLMERHSTRLYRLALSYLRRQDDALDAVQETFVRAFQNAVRWDPNADVVPWLTRIAINHCIDVYRRGRRRMATDEPLENDDRDLRLTSADVSADRRVLGREVGERIERALRCLPETQRAVFVLRHYEDMTLPEIADSLGISLGTVKSSLHRALHRMRQRLEGLEV